MSEIDKKIEELQFAVGASSEFLRMTRESLMANGFTRTEAVAMCTALMLQMLNPNNAKGNENHE